MVQFFLRVQDVCIIIGILLFFFFKKCKKFKTSNIYVGHTLTRLTLICTYIHTSYTYLYSLNNTLIASYIQPMSQSSGIHFICTTVLSLLPTFFP